MYNSDPQYTVINTPVSYSFMPNNNSSTNMSWSISRGQGTVRATSWNQVQVTWTAAGPSQIQCNIIHSTYQSTYTFDLTVVPCSPIPGATVTNYLDAGSFDACAETRSFTANTTTNCYLNDYFYVSTTSTNTENRNPKAQPSPDVYYRFHLSRPSQVTITTCNSTFDTYLHLVSLATGQVWDDDDSGNSAANCGSNTSYLSSVTTPSGLSAALPSVLPAGDYFIIAEGYSSNTGALQVNLTVTPQLIASLTVTASPQTLMNAAVEIIRGETITLTATGDGLTSYTWITSTGGTIGTAPSITVSPTTTTTYTVTGQGCNNNLVATARVTVQVALTDLNYITTTKVLIPGKRTSEEVGSMATFNATTGEAERQQATVYFDGLGRPMQQVAVQGSPAHQDVVVPIAYDNLGQTPITYLPYPSASSGVNGLYRPDAVAQEAAFYQPNSTLTRVAKDNSPFAQIVNEASPLKRILEQGAPGAAWQPGTGHTVRFAYRSNASGEVRQWTYDYASDRCSAVGTYAPGTLAVKETRDEQDGLVTEYVNTEGKTVLKQVAAVTGAATSLLTTYVYDDRNQLRLVISPEGYNNLPASFSWADAATYDAFTQNWCFRYRYDGRGRITQKQTPGTKKPVQILYNQLDLPVLTQDASQAARSEWAFTKYDALQRPVSAGIVVLSGSPAALQSTLDGETVLAETPLFTNSSIGYTLNNAYPRGITEDNLLTITYYDRYDYGYQQDGRLNASVSTQTTWVRGLVTGTCVRQVGLTGPITSTWLISKNYYDAESRLVQTSSLNHLSGVDKLMTTYDFAGRVTATQLAHTTFRNVNHTVANRFTYDNASRPLTTYQSTGGQPEVVLSQSHYNEIGQLVDKKLHNANWQSSDPSVSGKFLQKVDYRYNIRGWLTNINDRDLSNGAAVEGQVADPDGAVADPDLFGMDIHYNETPRLGGTPQFNGNIAEVMWKTRRPSTATGSDPSNILRGYAYSYDRADRVTGAQYQTYENGVWGKTSTDFTVTGITYDGNGNLRSMTRQGTTNGSNTTPVRGVLDQLVYSYSPATGNQLLGVDDSPLGNANSATHDFKDNGHNYAGSGIIEYKYDDNGNLISDLNKNITAINYSRLNQPVVVNITDSRGIANRIEYLYTATGTKLQKKVYAGAGSTPTNTTDYVGPFVYEQSAATPAFVQTPEGRALYVGSANGTLPWKYEYHLKDHLGNLRFAFRADQDNGAVTQVKAGMEQVNAPQEERQFTHLAETRLADPAYARTGNYVARLNARTGRRQGPSIRLNVTAGDSIRAEVYARYDRESGAATLLQKGALVVGATTSNVPGQISADQLQPTVTRRHWLPFIGASLALVPQLLKSKRAELPTAYLRYELFNKDSQLVATRTQSLRQTASDEWQPLQVGSRADSAGFVHVSLINESGVAAYFDDMALSTVAPTPYQENHYDPFGLNLVGIEQTGQPNSKFQYNGKEKQEDFGLNWTDYGARLYDAQLGRFHTIDPLSHRYSQVSGYSYALNNPLKFIDLFGLAPVYRGGAYYEGNEQVEWSYVKNWLESNNGIASTYRPLTKQRLEQIAGPTTVGDGKRQADIGNRFEAVALESLGLDKYKGPLIPSPARALKTKGDKLFIQPDAVEDITVRNSTQGFWSFIIGQNYEGAYTDVKATNKGAIPLSYDNYQLYGDIHNLAATPAALNGNRATLTIVGLANSYPGASLIKEAANNHVSLFMIWALEKIENGNGTGIINFTSSFQFTVGAPRMVVPVVPNFFNKDVKF